jgi:hypothetical protein
MPEEIDRDYLMHSVKDVYQLDERDSFHHQRQKNMDESVLQRTHYIPQMSFPVHGKQKE